jgi:hypothetical protein
MDLETDSELEGDKEGVDTEEEAGKTRNTWWQRQRHKRKETLLDNIGEEEEDEELGMSML